MDTMLASVENQTYDNVEVVLVDDGSTDGSDVYLEQYAAHHDNVMLIFQKNKGVSAARNVGIRASHGSYVMSLDADDRLDSSYVERCVEALEDHPEYKLVYTKADTFGNRNEVWELPPYRYEEMIWGNLIFVSAMYRRADFDNTEGYNENMKHGLEDWDFWLSFLGPDDMVHRIDEVLFHWRITDNSRSKEAEVHELENYQQLYLNHKDVFSPYMDQLVYFREKWAQYELLYENLSCVLQSKAYRFGKFFTRSIAQIIRFFQDGK